MTYRGESGYYADVMATDLGLDIRRLEAQSGREGLYNFRLGYAEIPRYFADGATNPVSRQWRQYLDTARGLPGRRHGIDAAVHDAAADRAGLQGQPFRPDRHLDRPAELHLPRRPAARRARWHQADCRLLLLHRVAARGAGGLHRPISSRWPRLYVTPRLQATLAYQLSQFSNGNESLTWSNPFLPVVPGATQGQLAQAPDNQFHQIVGSIGYQVMPTLRASADFAVGRMTQNADYLASTLNASLAPSVPALPSASLDGSTDTYNGNVKLTYTPMDNLRVNAIYAWDVRDNETAVQSYPMVSTDMFLAPTPRSNTPFSLTQNRFKINADYRGPGTWKLNGGIDWDSRERTYTEVVNTTETTLWGRASVQALENLGLSFNLAHGDRNPSTYGVAYWFPAREPADAQVQPGRAQARHRRRARRLGRTRRR